MTQREEKSVTYFRCDIHSLLTATVAGGNPFSDLQNSTCMALIGHNPRRHRCPPLFKQDIPPLKFIPRRTNGITPQEHAGKQPINQEAPKNGELINDDSGFDAPECRDYRQSDNQQNDTTQ